MTPSLEQQVIFDTFCSREPAHQHIIVDAKAGAGKSSTLRKGLPLLSGTILMLMFNRSIADDTKQEVAADNSIPFVTRANLAISTTHAHGLKAYTQGRPRPQVQGGKMSFMLGDEVKKLNVNDPLRLNTSLVTKLAGFAKQSGFGLTSASETFPSLADKEAYAELIAHHDLELDLKAGYTVEALIDDAIDLLLASNKRLGMIDFDDMIYLPLLLNCTFQQFDNVLIDEAQDINATRRELAFRSCKPSGRMIVVGDPNQAIYGFTGASTSSLDQIADRCSPPPVVLPLSTCWRCDDAILDQARTIVPAINTAPSKLGKGKVSYVSYRSDTEDFLSLPRPGDAILCRLNRPNVATALGLLRRGVPAKIEGRDLGKKLLDHVKRADDSYGFNELRQTLGSVEDYRDTEEQKLLLRGRESAAALLVDECDAAMLLMERAMEVNPKAAWKDLEALVASLFGDEVQARSCVTLSSVHKAKGREWPRVFILGRDSYMPFFKASEGWQMEQEYNLIYVAITRAEHELTYVTGVQAALDKQLHREAPLSAK